MDQLTDQRIERSIELNAPVARVWRALTDQEEFGTWFRARLDGPFAVGKTTRGQITLPGYEHLALEAAVVAIEPERRFAFTWHPYPIDPQVDYGKETPTLVEFTLAPTATGTRLTVSESGFEKLPAARRDEAFRMNDGGWQQQLQNIRTHVDGV